MQQIIKIITLVAVLLAAAAVISGCSGTEITVSERILVDDRGDVTVEVEWDGTDDSSLVFNVAMNTHSVDLDGYDLAELAVLRDDSGNEYRPVRWDSAPGGHHRQWVLTFPLPDSVSQGRAGQIEIVIRDIAGIEARTFKWDL